MYNITIAYFQEKSPKRINVFFKSLLLLLLTFHTGWSQQILPHYDGLNYTVGQSLSVQNAGGWILNQSASNPDMLITAGSLSYPGLAVSTGNKVSFVGGGEDAIKSFTTYNNTSGVTVYCSYLMNITNISIIGAANDGYLAGFIRNAEVIGSPGTAPGSGAIASPVWVKPSANAGFYNIGFSARANQTTIGTGPVNLQYGTTDYPLNTPVLIVVSYQPLPGSNNDICKLWINPTPGQPEPAFSFTATASSDLADISGFFIKQNGSTSTPASEMDEIRFGLTWADVTPAAGPAESIVNLKLFIEGYYVGGGTMTPVADNQAGVFPPAGTDVEMITVELHNTTAPYDVVASTAAMLKTDGTAVCNFSTAPNGSYYIGVKTKNAIQTWSAEPQTVGAIPLNYDFTTAANKAYGDNMIDFGGVFAFYSGDILDNLIQDGLIDGTDYSIWEADNNDFAFGVYVTDLNGDGLVDGSDYSIWEANNNNFVFANYPQ